MWCVRVSEVNKNGRKRTIWIEAVEEGGYSEAS